MIDREGELLRAELIRVADTVHPAFDGLALIRARIAEPLRPWWRRLLALIPRTSRTAAPEAPGTADRKAVSQKGITAMTIIRRPARDVRAGDIITADPDHNNRPVRWRVQAPPKVTADGIAIVDFADLTGVKPGVAWFDSHKELSVEPTGGAR
ncbi:hypothetical protein [Spirillospora sp. CA-128828]|uniref:hypothetical protein n=1 Tax=Spirillospora sp. CA-128828 TaxID=3240033 RepID=UPI003D8A9AB7